jgi:hypothetical protein
MHCSATAIEAANTAPLFTELKESMAAFKKAPPSMVRTIAMQQ